MPDQFLREIPETVDKVKTWDWSRKGALEVETEALIFAAQEQALRANYAKFKIDMLGESPLCRFCGQKCETTNHIIGASTWHRKSTREDTTILPGWFTAPYKCLLNRKQ